MNKLQYLWYLLLDCVLCMLAQLIYGSVELYEIHTFFWKLNLNESINLLYSYHSSNFLSGIARMQNKVQ